MFIPVSNEVNQLSVYIYPLSLIPPSTHPHPTPLGHPRALDWAPWVLQHIPTSYFTHGDVSMSIQISQFCLTLSFPSVYMSVLCIWVSVPAMDSK